MLQNLDFKLYVFASGACEKFLFEWNKKIYSAVQLSSNDITPLFP